MKTFEEAMLPIAGGTEAQVTDLWLRYQALNHEVVTHPLSARLLARILMMNYPQDGTITDEQAIPLLISFGMTFFTGIVIGMEMEKSE